MPSCKVTIGTTAAKLLALIRGDTPPAGASISKTFPGLITGNGCGYLRLEPDTGIVFIGDDSAVSSTNNGGDIDAAVASRIYERMSDNNDIPLNIWLIGNAASQIVNVTWQYK